MQMILAIAGAIAVAVVLFSLVICYKVSSAFIRSIPRWVTRSAAVAMVAWAATWGRGGGFYSPIPRVYEADLPWEAFRDRFLLPGIPVIIVSGSVEKNSGVGEEAGGAPASLRASYEKVAKRLVSECGGTRVNVMSDTIETFLNLLETSGLTVCVKGTPNVVHLWTRGVCL